MRFSNFSYIIAANLSEKKWRTFFAICVIAFGVAVALAVTAISNGLLKGIQEKAASLFPPTVVNVKPKTVGLAMLEFNSATITDETVKAIRELPGVGRVRAQLSLKIPLRMEVEIAGQYAVTDAVVIGVEPETMTGVIKPGFKFQYDETTSQPIPAVVPRMLLDMYNLAYADSIGFPKLNESILVGKRFTMVLGQTYLAGGNGGKQDKLLCQVVGMSNDSSLVPGVYVPMEHARVLNRWYTGADSQPYTAVQVTINDPGQVPDVSRKLSDLGLLVEGKQWAYESVSFAIKAATALLAGFAFLILLVTSFSILNLFSLMMVSRTDEMRLLNAVGATRLRLRMIYFCEALVIAVAGIALGATVVIMLLKQAEKLAFRELAKHHLMELNVIPDRLFSFSFLEVSGVILLVLAMSVAAPLVITWRATSGGIKQRN